MADLKRWFKVWTSILEDPEHSGLSLDDVGRWTRLGAMTALVGQNGRLTLREPAKRLCQALEVTDMGALKTAIGRLPNVHVEEGKNSPRTFCVTWKNWLKYQRDSTAADRMRALRSKRRGEERRGEETRRDEKVPPIPVPQGFDEFWKKYPNRVGKGNAEESWRRAMTGRGVHKGKPSPVLPEILHGIARWCGSRKWQEGFIPNPATWLNQRRWEDDPPGPSPLGQKTAGNVDALRRAAERIRGGPDDQG